MRPVFGFVQDLVSYIDSQLHESVISYKNPYQQMQRNTLLYSWQTECFFCKILHFWFLEFI